MLASLEFVLNARPSRSLVSNGDPPSPYNKKLQLLDYSGDFYLTLDHLNLLMQSGVYIELSFSTYII